MKTLAITIMAILMAATSAVADDETFTIEYVRNAGYGYTHIGFETMYKTSITCRFLDDYEDIVAIKSFYLTNRYEEVTTNVNPETFTTVTCSRDK